MHHVARSRTTHRATPLARSSHFHFILVSCRATNATDVILPHALSVAKITFARISLYNPVERVMRLGRPIPVNLNTVTQWQYMWTTTSLCIIATRAYNDLCISIFHRARRITFIVRTMPWKDVCTSVCPSVRHTPVFCLNGYSYPQFFFTIG